MTTDQDNVRRRVDESSDEFKYTNDVILAHAAGEEIPEEVLRRFADSFYSFSCRALYRYENPEELIEAYRDLEPVMREFRTPKPKPPVYQGRRASSSLGCPKCSGPSSIKGEPCDGCA